MSDAHGRFVVIPAAYVFFLRGPEDAREVLLQLRRGTGYMDEHWAAAAAGHVERGETVLAAAAREAEEEVGVTDLELQPVCAMQRTGADGQAIDERVDYFFTATSWSGEPRIIEPEKCAELHWFALDDLPDPVVPHEHAVLTALASGVVPPIMMYGF